MKNIAIFLIASLFCSSCEVIDDPVDTGICESNKDETMWEYFINTPEWELTVEAIEYAGIKYMFDGSDPDYQEMTFLGITRLSIVKFLTENGLRSIYELPSEQIRTMLLSHLIKGRIMKEDCDYEIKGTNKGGKEVISLTGKIIRMYRIKTPGNYGPDTGPAYMAVHALESGFKANIASADIEKKNGVIHSLTYDYAWTEL